MSNLYFAAKDMGIRIDYARLLEFLVGERRLQRAYAYLGVAPDDENSHSFITWLSRNGFRVRTKLLRRYEDGTTKANLDMELAIDLLTQAPHIDVAIIVSGDGDFVSLVDAAQRAGLRVEVAATPRQNLDRPDRRGRPFHRPGSERAHLRPRRIAAAPLWHQRAAPTGAHLRARANWPRLGAAERPTAAIRCARFACGQWRRGDRQRPAAHLRAPTTLPGPGSAAASARRWRLPPR